MAYTDDYEQLVVDASVATNLLNVVGRGIDFPLRYSDLGVIGTIETSSAGERINDAIHIILSTNIGERMFNLEFGSRLPQLLFEPNDEILQRLLVHYTYEALQRWEKRISVTNVAIQAELNDDASTIGVGITYVIRNSHIQGSYVYPFVKGGMQTALLHTGSEAARMGVSGQVIE